MTAKQEQFATIREVAYRGAAFPEACAISAEGARRWVRSRLDSRLELLPTRSPQKHLKWCRNSLTSTSVSP